MREITQKEFLELLGEGYGYNSPMGGSHGSGDKNEEVVDFFESPHRLYLYTNQELKTPDFQERFERACRVFHDSMDTSDLIDDFDPDENFTEEDCRVMEKVDKILIGENNGKQ